jgi:hypothetical protein
MLFAKRYARFRSSYYNSILLNSTKWLAEDDVMEPFDKYECDIDLNSDMDDSHDYLEGKHKSCCCFVIILSMLLYQLH